MCSSDLLHPEGHLNWVDKAGSVKLNGQLSLHGQCVSEDDWQGTWYSEKCELLCVPLFGYGTHVAQVDYRSTNPKKPGSGVAIACLKDNGEGVNKIAGDQVALFAISGVYAGYISAGTVRGNVQSGVCTDGVE
mgnify:CR=1 FL=1